MGKQTIKAMVEGGKATPAPPLGPALSPLKVDVKRIIETINQKTRELAGMQVPIKVIVNEDKSFDVEVGTPPVSALIKAELKLEKGGGEAGIKRVGDLTHEQVRKIAKMKFGAETPQHLSQVEGTARAMGVSVGKGAITEDELKKYAEMDRLKQEAAAAKAAAAAAPAAGAAAPVAGAPAASAPTAAAKEEKPMKAEKK
ncbi:MAG: 50S ribosomal protein L11 [Candidatus Aenigmarchaeota archaeon]|nr:50S ribosomal protein L11 [Candidatus Aenigmarchaeota archaeon]